MDEKDALLTVGMQSKRTTIGYQSCQLVSILSEERVQPRIKEGLLIFLFELIFFSVVVLDRLCTILDGVVKAWIVHLG